MEGTAKCRIQRTLGSRGMAYVIRGLLHSDLHSMLNDSINGNHSLIKQSRQLHHALEITMR